MKVRNYRVFGVRAAHKKRTNKILLINANLQNITVTQKRKLLHDLKFFYNTHINNELKQLYKNIIKISLTSLIYGMVLFQRLPIVQEKGAQARYF
jgi:predicted metal-dependent hydrolase